MLIHSISTEHQLSLNQVYASLLEQHEGFDGCSGRGGSLAAVSANEEIWVGVRGEEPVPL